MLHQKLTSIANSFHYHILDFDKIRIDYMFYLKLKFLKTTAEN